MDINKEAASINSLRQKIMSDLSILLKKQSSFEKDVQRKFRVEFNRNKQSMDNLEDFYHLSYLSKKNLQSVTTAHNLISRMDDLSRFDIQEEDVITEILSSNAKG